MPRLKALQRRLLDGFLSGVPCHEAAHGFMRGRNVATLRTLGLPDAVVERLALLCLTRTPAPLRERLREEGSIDVDGARRLASFHLPQGAPSSPALANLCAFPMDLRLDGLAHRFGARPGGSDLARAAAGSARLGPAVPGAVAMRQAAAAVRRDQLRIAAPRSSSNCMSRLRWQRCGLSQ